MSAELRMGVIGCGEISGLTTWGYRIDDRVKICAVSDTNTERVEQCASEWNAEKIYGDYRELLDDQSVDAVMIITPHDLHKQMVIDALDAGKHVSVQKPMARDAAECKEMIEAANRAKGKFQVFECYPFYPPVAKAKELIDAGEIGNVSMIRLRTTSGSLECGWELTSTSWEWKFNQERVGGGTMFDDMHHKYALGIFFGGPVEKVSAFIENPGMFLDTPATVMWKHKAPSCYGILDAAYAPDLIIDTKYYPVEERIEITGAEGILWVTRLTACAAHSTSIDAAAWSSRSRQAEFTTADSSPLCTRRMSAYQLAASCRIDLRPRRPASVSVTSGSRFRYRSPRVFDSSVHIVASLSVRIVDAAFVLPPDAPLGLPSCARPSTKRPFSS